MWSAVACGVAVGSCVHLVLPAKADFSYAVRAAKPEADAA